MDKFLIRIEEVHPKVFRVNIWRGYRYILATLKEDYTTYDEAKEAARKLQNADLILENHSSNLKG